MGLSIRKYTLIHMVACNQKQAEDIKNTLKDDMRCKSLRKPNLITVTAYMRVSIEEDINALETEFQTKFPKTQNTFTRLIPLRWLPDDILLWKKIEGLLVYFGATYGTAFVGMLGTNYKAINQEIINYSLIFSALPALSAFFLKLQKRYE